MADADNWELVSLTASTYAAAPGPISPVLLLDAHKTGELSNPPPPPPPAIFMSQHFNWSEAVEALAQLNGRQEESTPPAVDTNAMVDDDTHLDMLCPENCEREQLDDSLARSDSRSNTLDDGNFSLAGEERQTEIFCSADAHAAAAYSDIRGTSAPHVSAAAAAAAAAIVETASHVPVAVSSSPRIAPRMPREAAQAWWKKTFSFLRNNARESLTFRVIFVAATVVGLAILGQREKLQLQQLRLEFDVHSEISCGSVGEPLGQMKGGMIVGGSPVAHG
ncbi:ATG8-interacting protein 1 isoform X2 [Brachypodium distachyon]|uniref:ATG8-interacting protein 1 isoform X2 n=1 Tax=Brachypodium distachyon TaxID=15368 RepID=UPI0001D43E6F|nr:ATG8-interacting protein 1 isoform X2 [Brachypodium distachyon]|eukprot:XP_010238549.1 ATG8-interacting protein 1 isoform X2 [Brachypodium distachyon]